MHLFFSRFNFPSTCFFVFSLTCNWSCRAKRELTTWLYECVKISLVGRKQVQCRKDSTASKRHVSMFVQEPRLTKELLSFKKSMVRFLFNGEGLDVHLVDPFFFFYIFLARRSFAKRVPAALAFTSVRGARTTRSIAWAFGSSLVWHIGAILHTYSHWVYHYCNERYFCS